MELTIMSSVSQGGVKHTAAAFATSCGRERRAVMLDDLVAAMSRVEAWAGAEERVLNSLESSASDF
jgi:hypothetical protein